MYLDEFWDEDRILVINNDGTYYTTSYDLTAHFEDNIWRIEKWNPEKVWSLIQWNGELKYYYGKRFKLDDAKQQIQSLLGEDKDSRIAVLSDREDATFRVTFADEKKEPLELIMEEFIDEKSAKAKGKRITTLEVASIEDITPAPVMEEPESEKQEPEVNDQMVNDSFDVEGVPMTIEKPKDTQLDLF